MRHAIVLRATTLALVLGWTQSQAAEEKYPAAHFEPKVIYQATDVAPGAESPAPSATDGDYPAAYFEPKVVYQDPKLIETVRAQPVQPPVEEQARSQVGSAPKAPVQTKTAEPVRETAPKPKAPAGPVSDVTPPYGMLAFALGIIALAFWWSTRRPEAGESAEGSGPEAATETAEAEAASADDAGEEEEELEDLAEAAVANLAHSNRQHANKTRRVRRR